MNQNFMSSTMLHNISEEQLMNFFSRINAQFVEIHKKLNKKPSEELLSRNDVARILKCDLSTVHNYTKKGFLKSYGINGRVYYKMHEVECALIPIKRTDKK
jgi:hypothetical protein